MEAAPCTLLLDQGVPRDAAACLRSLGLPCTHVGEIGLAQASDEAILALAVAEKAIVVTLDADFHNIIAVTGAASPSVIRLRLQGLRGRETADLVHSVIVQFQDDLSRGALVTVKHKKVTCRKLPVTRPD